MNARGGELVGQVLLSRGEQDLAERPFVQLRAVVQPDLLAVARERAVIGFDDGLQQFRRLAPPGVDRLAVFDELAVVDLQHHLVGCIFSSRFRSARTAL